ncbi:MAG: hypothetical protein ACXABK_02090, partial [Candidatus Heimdallarchaeaceae archaeon]
AALFSTAVDLNLPVVSQGNGLIDPLEAYNYLEENNNEPLFSINPTRISPENLYYYECVEGKTTEFRVKLVSSENQSISTSVEGDTEFIDIQPIINVYEGWNHFSFNISIPLNTDIQNINAKIIFLNAENVRNELDVNIQTRFYGGTVLFDISHDNDTTNNWFDASAPYASHLFLSRRLKDRGFYVEYHIGGNYSLADVHVLVISDPELNYTTDELSAISDYVQNGGSVLFLVNGMRLIDSGDIEDEPLISSNYYACDQVLELFEAKVLEDFPIQYVPYEIEVLDNSGIINTDTFFFWGWPVVFDLDSTNPNNRVLAKLPTFIINEVEYNFGAALSTEIGEGRVMIFGSGYPFTDIGLLPDTFEYNPERAGLSNKYRSHFLLDTKNSQLVNDTFYWLIQENRPVLGIDINPDEVFIRKSFTLQFGITKEDGAPYHTPPTLNGTIIHPDHSFEQFELSIQPEQYYEAEITLSLYGWHTIYVPLKLANHTPTDGRIDVFCNVALWDYIPMIKNISIGVVAFIVIAIVITPSVRSRFRKEEPKVE